MSDFWSVVNKYKKKQLFGSTSDDEDEKIVQTVKQAEAGEADFQSVVDAYRQKAAPIISKDLFGDTPIKTTVSMDDDIAPVKDEDDSLLDFFQKGSFEDGYQFGDVTKAILGTAGDVGLNVVKGGANLLEGLVDVVDYGIAAGADALGHDDYAERLRKLTATSLVDKFTKPADDFLNKYSVLGRTSDSIAQGIGQVGGIILTGGLGQAAGLGSAGVTALTTGTMGISGMGSGMGEAYQSGATDEEAVQYGLISGAADALSELMFGGLGKAVNATGLSTGVLGGVDDILAKKVSNLFSSQIAKNFAEFGIKATAEGIEEVVAGIAQAMGKKMTYLSEEEFTDILKDENLLEQFVVGMAASGIAQAPGVHIANRTNTDFITGQTQNEQAVVKKEVEKRIAELETEGKKLTNKQKADIQEQVEKDMEKGYISTDTIEETLGGETWVRYKETIDRENALKEKLKAVQEEFDTLNQMKQGEMTGEQIDRRADLKLELEKMQETVLSAENHSIRDHLKQELGKQVSEIVRSDRLIESYNERARRGQSFKADLQKYDVKQRAVIENAQKSGILNNTNRTHEFVDMVAKISADKGVLFDFTNNARLKESGFAVDGRAVNGYVTKDGITVNIQSPKALNSTVGHEITHVLEGTDLYTELQNSVIEYAKTKGEYQERFDALTKLYQNVEGADINAELTADLVGDYLFTDSDFINNLSVNHRNVFQRIYDEVKYLVKVATAGSKEARELEKVKRAFDKAYRESENAAQSEEISDSKTKYSIREEAPPKETGVAYKVFFVKDGKLYPPMVANPDGADTPMGVWLNADVGTAAPPSKTGRAQVKAGGKGTQGGSGSLAFRPGWHLGDLPRASQFDRLNPETGKKELFPENFVWAEVEYAKDVDYQEEAMSYGYTDKGKFRHAYAGLPRLPENGYYRYRTNPKPDTVPWVITGAMKVNRLLSDAEVNAILEKNGVPAVHRQGGDVGLDKFGFNEDGSTKYSLSVEQEEYFKDSVVRDENGSLKVMYHGTSGGGHTVFDPYGKARYGLFGAGSYFTDSKEVAEGYTKKGKGTNPQVYETYLNITNPLDMDAQADPSAWAKAMPNVSFPESGTNEQFYRAMEEYFEDNEYPRWEAAETAMYAIEDMGHDGVTHIGGGRVNADSPRHRVYIAFQPEQIKNVTNTKPTGSADIRYSLSDSDGNQISQEQAEYFKDSKIRDREGNLRVVYHTTKNDFTVFDHARKGEATDGANTFLGFFFAESPDHMEQFPEFQGGKTDAYYLDMKKPMDLTSLSREAFMDIVELTGGDRIEAAEVYDQELEAEQARARLRGDNNTSLSISQLLYNMVGDYYQEDFFDALKPNYDKLVAKGYDGVIDYLDEMMGEREFVVFDSNQAKLTSNLNPTSDPDIRYSLTEEEAQETNRKLSGVNLQYDAKSGTVYSLSSLEDAFDYNKGEEEYRAAREEYVNALMKATGKTSKEANRYIDSLFLVHDLIADDRDRLDYEAAVNRTAWVSNAEYGGSIDFSTLCAKRRLFTGTFDAIQMALPDTVLNENDFLKIRDMLLKKGYESPCSMCYVEGSRAKHGVYVDKWLKEYLKTNPEWKPQIADFASTTRLEQTRIQHPEAYAAYKKAMNALSQRKPKEASVRTDYKGEILRDFRNDSTVAEKNKNGGVRFNSFSDFEIIHALDAMQVITDMARVGLNGQAYTKVKEFAEAFGNTGLKINLSLVAKDVDATGKLILDETNGMKYAEAMDIRNRYSENVGTVIVVFNDAQLKAALADSSIDYVLPFHRSQWKKSQYALMGLPEATRDYTNIQNERYKNPKTGRPKKVPTGNIMPNEYWDFRLSGRENAQKYLDYINENSYIPKFDFLLNRVDGKWTLPEGEIGDGYFKLLIDFKMYDNDGWGSPQRPVLPEFNMPYIEQMLEDYKGGHQAFPVAHDVVNEFVQSKKHSLSEEGAEHPVYGNYSVYGRDVALEVAPVAETATTTEESPVVEEIAPTYDVVGRKGVPDGQQAFMPDAGVEAKVTRKQLHQNIVDRVKGDFQAKGFDFDKVLKNAKDLSTFATVDNTPQRVMEKALGYKQGQILSDITVNKVAQNETEGIKWLNSFTDRKNGLLAQISKQYGILPGSKHSAAAQMYAEGFYVGENDEIIAYGDKELEADFPDVRDRNSIKGLANDPRIRQIYDETLNAINESRKRNAYPEIPRLDNYFLHFRAMEDTFSRLGLPFNPNDIRAKDLPTDLNGVTADLKPGQPYFASAQHRTGKRTSFDLLGGLEKYLTSAKNQIYHIDDIQTLRALRNYIAATYGQATGLENLNEMSDEEAAQRIEAVYGSHLSTFAKFLNEEANVLAGKTALIDRGLEGIIGRRGITFLNTLNRQVGSNMVGYNISSSLTNFLAPVQALAKTNKADFLKGFAQTAANRVSSIFGKGDGFADNSPVMIRRKGAEAFYRTPWQKVSDPGYVLMGAVDDISTELIARTKYNEFIRKGMDSQTAHIETDKWVSRLMGDRSLGQQPQLYNSKMLGIITKFQLEVRNQLDSQFYDTIQEAKVSTEDIQNGLARNAVKAAKIASTFTQLAVLQHLFGSAFESVAGYNPAFDIIEVIIKTFGWDDDEEEEDTFLDNIEEGFFALMDDMPYVSTMTGGRIPLESALPIKELYKGEDQYGNEKSRWETLSEAAPYWLLPGGYGQIKKTRQGLGMFDEDLPIAGSYTDSGKLRFPVDDTPINRAQAAIFGQYASENARDYFDNERAPLGDKQIVEFMDSELPIRDYWEYREGLKGLKTLDEQADYIDSLDLPISTKNLFINNLSDRKEKIDMTGYGRYSSFDEFDFAEKYPEKYEIAKAVGGYENYMTYQEDMKGLKLEEKVNYVAGLNLTTEQKNILINGETDRKEPIDLTGYEGFSSFEEFEFSKEYPERYALAKSVGGYDAFKQYSADLNDISADKDEYGKSISGSRKEKVYAYVYSLDIPEIEQHILFKSEYTSFDDANYEIIEYLNEREDISFGEMRSILIKLGFEVDSEGNIYW